MGNSISAAVVAETNDFERKMANAKKANDNFLASALKADKGLAQLARVGGKGLQSLNMGLMEMERAAAGGAINVTALGTSLLGAFAMGGGIGLAISAASTAMGLLSSKMNEGRDAAREMAQQAQKSLDGFRTQVHAAAASLDRMLINLRAIRAENRGQEYDKAAALRAQAVKEQADALQAAKDAADKAALAMENYKRSVLGGPNPVERAVGIAAPFEGAVARKGTEAEQAAALRALMAARDEANKLVATREKELKALKETNEEERIKAETAAATNEQVQAAVATMETAGDRQRARDEQRAADASVAAEAEADRLTAIRDEVLAQEAFLKLRKEDRGYASEILQIEALRKQGYDVLADQLQGILDMKRQEASIEQTMAESQAAMAKFSADMTRRAKEISDKKQAQIDTRNGLRDELDLLRAGSQYERERIRVQQELRDELKKLAGDEESMALARQIAKRELLDIDKQEVEAAKAKAEAESRTTAELREQQRLKRVTNPREGFIRAPGTGGMFGFGAGTAGLGWTEGRSYVPRSRSRRATSGTGEASSVDASPALIETANAIKSLGGTYEQMAAAATRLAQDTKAVVTDASRVTTKAINSFSTEVASMRAEVRALQESVSRAGGKGVAGV